MKFGVCLPNFGPHASPTGLAAIAQAAEELGFRSVWATDHLLVPTENYRPYGRLLEALTLLSFLVTKTKEVRLGTSVLIVPMRNPVEVAKQVATIDVLSGGRALLAVGAGWLEKEFRFLNANFAQRGAFLDESIRLVRTLWSQERINFQGKFFNIADGVFEPKPVQSGGPPIWVGGNSRSAMRRAARLGDGWHPVGPDPEKLKEEVEELRGLAKGEIAVVPRMPVELNVVRPRTYMTASGETRTGISGGAKAVGRDIELLREAGSKGLVCYFGDRDIEAYVEQMRMFAREIIPSY